MICRNSIKSAIWANNAVSCCMACENHVTSCLGSYFIIFRDFGCHEAKTYLFIKFEQIVVDYTKEVKQKNKCRYYKLQYNIISNFFSILNKGKSLQNYTLLQHVLQFHIYFINYRSYLDSGKWKQYRTLYVTLWNVTSSVIRLSRGQMIGVYIVCDM